MGEQSPRMRIAALINPFGELSQSWEYRQLLGLRRYRPEVLTGYWKNEDLFPYDPVHVVQPPRDIISRGLRFLRRTFWGRPHDWPRSVLCRFAGICRDRRIRLLHAHFGWTGTRALPLAKETKLPLVVSFYGSDVNCLDSRPLYEKRLPKLFEVAELLLPSSQFLGTRLLEMGCDPEKVRVQHVGVHPEDFREKIHLDSGARTRFVSVGRLIDWKNHIMVLRAFAAYLRENRQGSLVMIGDGPLRDQVGNVVSELGIENQVELAGARPPSYVTEVLANADICVHGGKVASDGGVESLGVSILEASASGLPVVAADVGGIPEAVVRDETGFLVPPGDHEAMADRMLELAGDADLRARMGEAGRRHVEENFDSAKLNARLESIYDEVLAGGR